MKAQQAMVAEFHIAARHPDPVRPAIPSLAIQALRLNLHEEEAVKELRDAFRSGNIVEVADSIADALYVILGTACACGIDIEPIFNEVHRSNMTKFHDGSVREDGKQLKGASYERPNIAGLIMQQMHPS